MAVIEYKTKEKPDVQKKVCKAIAWIGVRQTSYAEIAREAHVNSSDCRYAVLDLLEKGYLIRHKIKGYGNTPRGNRYAYEVTKEGEAWADIPLPEKPKELQIDVPDLFE